MFGIGGTELIVIVLFVIIVFGPDKIPEMARTAGKAMRMFKKVQEDVEHVIRAEIYTPDIMGTSVDTSTKTAAAAIASSGAQPDDEAASASAIWAQAATENDEEEGEEE